MSLLTKATRSLVRNVQSLKSMSVISASAKQCIQYQQMNAFGSTKLFVQKSTNLLANNQVCLFKIYKQTIKTVR